MVTDAYNEIIAAAVVLLYVLALVSTLEAIMQGRTSQGSIAWAISLLSIPPLAVPLYLVFGRNKFDGYREKREVIEAESRRLIQARKQSVEEHIIPTGPEAPYNASLLSLARVPATTGNEVELLIDGRATFDSILAGLQSASRYILFQFYIIRDDELGRTLARALQDRAKAGVDVYLLYDEVGSRGFHKTGMYKQLVMVGVKVAAFNTTQGRRNRFQLNFRNHRKIVAVDGRQAWVGGHNVGVEYLGMNPKIGHWRDTHARIGGPAVMGVELAFATDWHWATQQSLNIEWSYAQPDSGCCDVLVFRSDPASEYEEAGLMFHQCIVQARERLWIASPYFVPDRGIVSALQLAALRGVDVRVLIPDDPDGPVVAMANWSYTSELLSCGVKVYRYRNGFMHQKVLLMDDQMAGVGTANFDNRSFRLNFEITLLIHNSDFARQVASMLEADMDVSDLVTAADLENKPIWFPLAMGVARLFSPVL
jgi:cardiolipin synthase